MEEQKEIEPERSSGGGDVGQRKEDLAAMQRRQRVNKGKWKIWGYLNIAGRFYQSSLA